MKEELAYGIKQTSRLTGIPEDTIRYYEKISLLPRIERKENGHRVYRQEDIQTIRLLSCLKKTGMPLEEMRPFLEVSANADPAEYPELVELLRGHRENIVSQIASLQQVVDFIDMKLEEGRYRGDCLDETLAEEGRGETEREARSISPVQMSYFPVTSAKDHAI
ncbi:MerR family transcriptional regulator [Paenibacillus yonginensis]|uniref:MerR family transcriptional regulator n=1 Tax=Paenibacillus yonginensis TaxID=1462996 RepID=A0A1B1MVR6_9BACL|nr:MerR family transcriptional regulator [Paenibacillus yonginensis]ANS73264.1 MerR family transcriptional regulator [Paenibacillus yonginensis]